MPATEVRAPSFLENRDVQPGLFGEENLIQQEKHGEFTGERLFERRPEVYKRLVLMLGQGASYRLISKVCGVSNGTISAVADREKFSVVTEKEKIVSLMRKGVLIGVERIVSEMHKMKREALPVTIGIMTDKMQLLSGEATQIVEHREKQLKHADLNDVLDCLPVEVTEEPVLGEEKNLQKGGSGCSETSGESVLALRDMCAESASVRLDIEQREKQSAMDDKSVVLPMKKESDTVLDADLVLKPAAIGSGDGARAENRSGAAPRVLDGGGGGS